MGGETRPRSPHIDNTPADSHCRMVEEMTSIKLAHDLEFFITKGGGNANQTRSLEIPFEMVKKLFDFYP